MMAAIMQEGQQLFKAMVDDHGIEPDSHVLTCMVDLLGRAGYLDDAETMLFSFQSDDVGLTCLLNACISCCNVEQAMRSLDHVVTRL